MAIDSLKKRKIAVLGTRSVGELQVFAALRHILRESITGKSSLVVRFIENDFVESYYPTIESTFVKAVNSMGTEYQCEIIDTAGQVCKRVVPCVGKSHSLTG
jgi:Ras homolog enriched in brain